MVIRNVTVNDCTPETIVIGRRGTFETMQVVFDLTYLIENYGDGTAVLALKRSQDSSAYPAVAAQDGNTLTWVVSDVDTYYVGAGECQLMWYVDGGLAKTIIYPMVVMRDILSTAEEPPDGYENWIEHLTGLGAETLQNAQNAAQSASDAESAKDDAVTAKEAAEEAAETAQKAVVHAPIIQNGYWYIWNDGQYVDTGVRAEGQKGDKGDTGEKGDTGNGIASITKTGTSGLVDTYTVTYTDGTTTTFTVTNGAKGDKGDTGATGNGIQSITKTGTSGNVDTYTITYTNGQTTTFTVTNGAVSSVAGKTGAVTLDANDVAFSESGTYDDGTVGKELSDQKNALNYIAYFSNGLSPQFDYVPKTAPTTASIKVTFPNAQFRLYASNGALLYNSDAYANAEFTITNLKKLALNINTNVISVVDTFSSTNYVTLLALSGNCIEGVLANYFFVSNLYKDYTVGFPSGKQPVFVVDYESDRLTCTIKGEIRFYNCGVEVFRTSAYVDQSYLLAGGECLVIDPNDGTITKRYLWSGLTTDTVLLGFVNGSVTGLLSDFYSRDFRDNRTSLALSNRIYLAGPSQPRFEIAKTDSTLRVIFPFAGMEIRLYWNGAKYIYHTTTANETYTIGGVAQALVWNVATNTLSVKSSELITGNDVLLLSYTNFGTDGLLAPYFNASTTLRAVQKYRPLLPATLYCQRYNSTLGYIQRTVCDARIAFISDIHKTEQAFRQMLNFTNRLSPQWGEKWLDIIVNGGDTVSNLGSEGLAWYNSMVDDSVLPILNCVGNHDVWYESGGSYQQYTPQETYQLITKKVAETANVVQPVNAETNGYNYYYKDINNVRVFVIDVMNWDSTQNSWLADTLNDARANGYHVIGVTHGPFTSGNIVYPDDPRNSTHIRDGYGTNIEAAQTVYQFIQSGGNFVCWLSGHTHQDEIGVLPDLGNQYWVSITTPRDGMTDTPKSTQQDDYSFTAFDCIGVDTVNGTVKFQRVGADINWDLVEHDKLCIDYVHHKILSSDLQELSNAIDQLLDSNESISEETVGFIKNNGTLDGNTAWHCLYTEKIACKPGWKYRYSGGTQNTIANSVLFFNGSNPVSQQQYGIGSDVEVTIPSGVDSVIFQSAAVSYAPISLSVKRTRPESIPDLQDDLITVNETVADIDDIVRAPIALSADTVGYIQNNGALEYDTGWHCLYTEKLLCEPGWVFKYKGWTYNGLANSVLFFNGDTPVSQLRYNAESDAVDIVVPDGVDGVIFQTASITSATLSLEVSRLHPAPLDNMPPELERMDAEIQQLSQELSSNAFYGKYNTAEIFDDLSKYSKVDTEAGTICPNPIPAYTWIDEVDFLSAGSDDGYIIIADSSLYSSYRRLRIVAMYPVTTVEGWNTVKINFNTGDCDSYLIGFSNIGISYGDYSTLPSSTDSKYRFSTVSAVNTYTLQAAPTIGAWISEVHSNSVYFMCYPFTVVAYTGIIPTASGKADSADNYVQAKRAIYTGTLLPKYKVIDGKEYGFVGRWYSYTYDGNPVMVASAAGAEVCFKVSGVDSITINWTGDNVSDDVYYCYEIDGSAKVRKNITEKVISLPNTDEHIIRIVCDSIPHNGTTNCWTPGYGWVFAGVTTSGGTLKGIVPTNKTIMYFGDSLTEGVRALGVESSEEVEADVDSATESYGWFASKYLQCTPIIAGYGSTGILADGYFRKCIDAINYLANGIETPDVSPDLIVINHGHNDSGWSDENWINGFNAVLDRIQVKYPGVQVVGLSPFNRAHADNMKACCEARSWCHYIDTTAWALDRFYVDGPGHLTSVGADVCGTLLAKEIKRLDLI